VADLLKDVVPHPEGDDLSSTETEHPIQEPYKPSKAEQTKVNNTIRRYTHYRDKRQKWHTAANEDLDFFNLKQWEDWEEDELTARGQAPLIVDQIYPRVTHLVSQLTAQMPEFRVTGRDDLDVRIAQIFNEIIQHILYTNDFREKQSEWVKDHCVYGVGYLLVEPNKLNEDGEGDIGITGVHAFDVFPDPESKERDLSDAERVIIARDIGKNRAMLLVPPEKAPLIRKLLPDNDPENKYSDSGKHDEEDVILLDEIRDENKDHVKYIEEYMRVWVKLYTGVDNTTGKTTPQYTAEELEAWKEDESIAAGIASGDINVVAEDKIRVLKRVIIGNILIGEEILKTSRYPIIPLFFEHQKNPYSMGVIRGLKGFQKERNKRRSLMIAHATASTNNKLLFIEGAVTDEKTIEQEWGRPNAAIKINPIGGNKISDNILTPGPQPMSNALFQLENQAKQDSDEWIGIDPLSTGVAEAAPPTAQATLALDEFGKRRQTLYTRNIGFSLRRMGKVIIDFIQGYWNEPNKIIRLVNPDQQQNQQQRGVALNVPQNMLQGDSYMPGEIEKVGDISVGKYDLIVVDGSTLPSNRWMLQQMYVDLYQSGIIDQIEVLKKVEVVDREGVMRRHSIIAKMQQQLQQLQEELNRKGQLLTREETKRKTAEQKTELANFQIWLGQQEVKVQKMLNDIELNIKSAVAEKKNESSGKKQS
jgi:hypothetical protein